MVAPGHIHPLLAAVAILCIAVGAGAVGRHQHVVRPRYRRDHEPHGQAADPAWAASSRRRRRLRRGAGDRFRRADGARGQLLAAGLLAFTILFYVFVYTIWLKRRTPQNIVIGGAAGAFPPMIGWAAVTGHIDLASDRAVPADLHVDAAAFLGAALCSAPATTPRPACRCCRWWPVSARPSARC